MTLFDMKVILFVSYCYSLTWTNVLWFHSFNCWHVYIELIAWSMGSLKTNKINNTWTLRTACLLCSAISHVQINRVLNQSDKYIIHANYSPSPLTFPTTFYNLLLSICSSWYSDIYVVSMCWCHCISVVIHRLHLTILPT